MQKPPGRVIVGRRSFLAGVGGAALLARRARADTTYLNGETLRIIVASSPGSGNDATARLFAEHLARLVPRTQVVVENLDRAGGRIAEKTLWEAPPDGRTIAFLRSSIFYRMLQDAADYPYSLQDFTWIGSLSQESRVLVATAASGVADLPALLARDRPLTLAVDTVTSTRYIVALLVNALLGTRLLPIVGYKGAGIELAAVAGEVEGVFNTFESARPVIESAGGQVLLRVGQGRLPAPFDSAPALRDQALNPAHRWVLQLIEAEANLGRFVGAPPATPAAELAVLRGLLESVAADPGFQTAATAIGLDVAVTPGAELTTQIAGIPRPDAATAASFQALLDCGLARAETGGGC